MRLVVLIAVIVAVIYLVWLNEVSKKNPPKVRYVNALPKPRQAMTIPPYGILILEKYRGSEVIHRHELCHWEQYQERGLLRFYADYFSDTLANGYKGNDLEKECFEKETV